MRKFTYWLFGLLLVSVAIGAVLLLNNIREITWAVAENAACEATLGDQGGVDINSAFRFSFEGDVGANAVRRFLSVEPAIELNYHQGRQAREVLAVPMEPLQPGVVYRFSLLTEGETLCWAFQTKSDWRVQSASPADSSVGVNVAAPIEIFLNQSLAIEPSAAAQYLEISPAAEGYFEQYGNCLRLVTEQPLAANTVYRVRVKAGLPAKDSDLTLAEDYSFAFETGNADGSLPAYSWKISSGAESFLPTVAPSFSCDFAYEPPPEAEMGGPPKLYAMLYRYADAPAYAADLLARQDNAPHWSMRGQFGLPSLPEGMMFLAAQEFTTAWPNLDYYNFSWPNALPPGQYLLYATWQGQSRELRFQVSRLSAFVQCGQNGSLIWAHDAQEGLPAAQCAVTYMNDGSEHIADQAGLALLSFQRPTAAEDSSAESRYFQDVYLLRYGEHELITVAEGSLLPDPKPDIWSYLQLSQDIYQSGDKLEFWGYMRRRDNSEWDWSRVSVYISAIDRPEQPVLQTYAPLSGNIFFGEAELPRLLPGHYQLEIWQSGQRLISKNFAVAEHTSSGKIAAVAGEGPLLAGDREAYALGDSYTLSLSQAGESPAGYLFFKSGGGLKQAIVEPQAQLQEVFTQDDLGGSFWQAASFEGGKYRLSPAFSLKPELLAYSLSIEIKPEQLRNTAGETLLSFSLKDGAGQAPNGAGLLVMIAAPGQQPADLLAELYQAGRSSGLLGGTMFEPPETAVSAQLSSGETIFFGELSPDKQGRAELRLALPAGQWQIYAVALADGPLPLGGNASIMLELPGMPPDQGDEPKSALPLPKLAWSTRYDMSAGNSHLIREGLLYFGATQRVQGIELLWPLLFSDDAGAEQQLAGAYAHLLWQRYGYGEQSLPSPPQPFLLQQAGGGVAYQPEGEAELFLSMLAASLAGQGLAAFDEAALTAYLQGYGAKGSLRERAMALAGLAALGQPVLQEIKLLLPQAAQLPYSRACLIWGLVQAGDLQVAKAAFHDFLDAFASDATSGNLYLEGGQHENIRLNQVSAWLAAACGDGRTALSLLQFLQNQQTNDVLSAAIVAGEILGSGSEVQAKAKLLLDGRVISLENPGLEGMWLPQPSDGNLLVEESEGELALTCLRITAD